MPTSPWSRRGLITAVLIAAALLGMSIPVWLNAGHKSSTETPAKRLEPAIVWQAPTPDVAYMAFAPGGRYFLTITKAGQLAVYTAQGEQVYCVSLPGVDRAVLAPDGSYAMAYSRVNPIDSTITILDSSGRVFWKTGTVGAAWCADSCQVESGARFVVGTGKRSVYVFDVSKYTRNYKWWRTGGAVVSINLEPDGQAVTYGTWQDAAITRAEIDGNVSWTRSLEDACLHSVEKLEVPDRMLLKSTPNRCGADGEYCILDSEGDVIWRDTISSSEHTSVVCSSDCRYVCTGATQTLQHKGKSANERHAVLHDPSGRALWEQGSMFFQVEPLLVSSGGEVLLVDDKGALYVVRSGGTLEASCKLPGSVVNSAQSSDGSQVLVKCSDGTLCLVAASR